jgi:hypothetical protein
VREEEEVMVVKEEEVVDVETAEKAECLPTPTAVQRTSASISQRLRGRCASAPLFNRAVTCRMHHHLRLKVHQYLPLRWRVPARAASTTH